MTDEKSTTGGTAPNDIPTRDRVFRAMPPGEPVIASELTDAIGVPKTTVNYNLNRLAEKEKILKKRFFPSRVTWVRPASGSSPAGKVENGENITPDSRREREQHE